jgi:hypothetical protein
MNNSTNPEVIKSGTRGAYFVANDRIIDLTIAFLNSFRKSNPDLPLCLIPFRADTERLMQLAEKYQFTVYPNQEMLAYCDQISRLFHPEVTGHYRKLACWHGPFDEFVYIDVDMVVLKPIDFSFELLNHYEFITSCSNIAHAEQWVWKPSVYQTKMLNQEQIRYAANTGYIISKKGVIPTETLMDRALEATKLSAHMELNCKEQPFLNYLIVTSGLRFSSLWVLAGTVLFPRNYIEYWAGNGKKQLLKGYKTHHEGQIREIFLIHWAGVWQPKPSEIKLFGLLKRLGIRNKIWQISILMPLHSLWNKYRKMH